MHNNSFSVTKQEIAQNLLLSAKQKSSESGKIHVIQCMLHYHTEQTAGQEAIKMDRGFYMGGN